MLDQSTAGSIQFLSWKQEVADLLQLPYMSSPELSMYIIFFNCKRQAVDIKMVAFKGTFNDNECS